MSNYDPLLTMAALNMAVVSLHRITSTKDRLILDQEYKNIINNLRMGEINADPELTGLYQEIVRVINGGRLRDDVRKAIEEGYSHEKQKGIKDVVTENALSSFDANPLKWLGNLAMSCMSEYFGSKKQQAQQDDEQQKLKSEELREYDELQRKLLDSSWKLLRQYELPDNYRLTQNALDKFYSATQENDPLKRLRMLKYLENDFSMYSPYWFYCLMAAQEADAKAEAKKSFSKFNEVWRPVLRKDPYKVEALKFQITGLMSKELNTESMSKIFECLSEMRVNTQLEDWANNIYEGTLYFMLGNRKKAIECVMCNIDFNFETEATQKLLDEIEKAKSKYDFGKSHYEKGEYAEAAECYREAAELGHADAQCILGVMYYRGEGVPKDMSEAVKWYRKAAVRGNARAQRNLGVRYDNGKGVAQDKAEAVKWYSKAAEQGDAEAQCRLGLMYDNGKGVAQDKAKAVEWYRKAAKQGHARAQNNLGVMYENGEGVGRDKAQAVKWYSKAAELDHAEAQCRLGLMYENGEGVAQDKAQAVEWYRKAAELGHADAQCNLAWMYDNGEGIAQDKAKAAKWYSKAAEQGHARAQNNLGVMYENGEGVPQDKNKAAELYRKAAELGHENAKRNLKILEAKQHPRRALTRGEIISITVEKYGFTKGGSMGAIGHSQINAPIWEEIYSTEMWGVLTWIGAAFCTTGIFSYVGTWSPKYNYLSYDDLRNDPDVDIWYLRRKFDGFPDKFFSCLMELKELE